MSEIVETLKDKETEDVFISNEDRIALVELMTFVQFSLESGKLWINKPGLEHNQPFICLCARVAKMFDNMKVHQEH